MARRIRNCEDLRIKWDYIKYKIRQDSIKYSKIKASPRKSEIGQIKGKLRACEETLQRRLLLRTSKALRKYFVFFSPFANRFEGFNLENHNKKKTCVTRLLNSDGAEITNTNNILEEVYNFYSDLYDEKTEIQTDATHRPFLVDSLTIPKLNDDMRKICDGQLTYSECFKVLFTFENKKAPGNNALSRDFFSLFLARDW